MYVPMWLAAVLVIGVVWGVWAGVGSLRAVLVEIHKLRNETEAMHKQNDRLAEILEHNLPREWLAEVLARYRRSDEEWKESFTAPPETSPTPGHSQRLP